MSSYVPTDWVDGVTPVNAANLDHMEAGIADAHTMLAEPDTARATDQSVASAATDLPWTAGEAHVAYQSITPVGGTIRSYGVPPSGAGTRLTIRHGAGTGTLGFVHAAAAGSGAKFFLQGGVALELEVGGVAEFVFDGTWWIWVPEIAGGIEYENVWDAGTAYQAGDVVTYGGVSYLAVNDSTGAVPPTVNAEVLTISAKTASYTPVLADAGTMLEMTLATALTLTVPTDAAVNFAVGTQIHFLQAGAGQITVVGAGGVTVNARPGLKTAGLWASGTLLKRAANNWVCLGNMVP